MEQTTDRRLVRSRRDRMVGGVCGGIAEHLRIDPTLVRLGAVALVLFGGAGFLLYAIAWAVLPDGPASEDDPPPRFPLLDRVPPVLLVVLGVVALFAVFDDGWGWPHLPVFPLALLAVGVFLVWGGRGEAIDDDEEDEAPPRPEPALEPHLATSPRRRRPRPGARFLAIGFGTVVAAVGVVSLAVAISDDVSPRIVVGIALAALGAVIAIGARTGGTRPFVPAALVLFGAVALWSAIDVPFTGGIGERTYEIETARDLPTTERLAIGQLTIDLRDTAELRAGQRYEVEASVGLGELLVYVPDAVSLVIDAEARAGEIEIGTESADGTSVDLDREFLEPDTPILVLDLEVGLGHVEVIGVP